MPKIAGLVSIIAAIVMVVAGIVTWTQVSSQLAEERITIPGDSEFMNGAYAGQEVRGPLTAYAQAEVIQQHSLAGAEGTEWEDATYAELGAMVREAREAGDEERATELQDRRNSVMNASFLRASLFTSVVAYGVAALVIGLGVLFGVIGAALMTLPGRKVETVREVPAEA